MKLSSEPGLLSIAFAPDYATSGLFYVFYNSTAGKRRHPDLGVPTSPDDPDLADVYTERSCWSIPKPWENHNGGMLQFGPDGSSTRRRRRRQRRPQPAGLLRAEPRRPARGHPSHRPAHGDPYAIPGDNPFVGVDGVRPEIWAYGLRNPWRFWIDHETGAMFIGDAGNARREEIDVVRARHVGLNFGWPCFEGTLPFDCAAHRATTPSLRSSTTRAQTAPARSSAGSSFAIRRSRHSPGATSTATSAPGGSLQFAVANGRVAADRRRSDSSCPELSSFGVDGLGRVYVMSLRGDVYRLDPRPAP